MSFYLGLAILVVEGLSSTMSSALVDSLLFMGTSGGGGGATDLGARGRIKSKLVLSGSTVTVPEFAPLVRPFSVDVSFNTSHAFVLGGVSLFISSAILKIRSSGLVIK